MAQTSPPFITHITLHIRHLVRGSGIVSDHEEVSRYGPRCVLLLAPCWPADHFSTAAPVELNKEGRRWVEQTLKKLSLEEKVGQMLSVRYFTDFQNFSGDSYVQFRDQMRKYHVGSVVLTVHVDGSTLLKNPPLEVAAVANQLQRDSELPLLIARRF